MIYRLARAFGLEKARTVAVSDWRNVLLVEHKGGTMDPADPDNEQNVDGGPGSGPDPTSGARGAPRNGRGAGDIAPQVTSPS